MPSLPTLTPSAVTTVRFSGFHDVTGDRILISEVRSCCVFFLVNSFEVRPFQSNLCPIRVGLVDPSATASLEIPPSEVLIQHTPSVSAAGRRWRCVHTGYRDLIPWCFLHRSVPESLLAPRLEVLEASCPSDALICLRVPSGP
jgi:hypothetical protein